MSYEAVLSAEHSKARDKCESRNQPELVLLAEACQVATEGPKTGGRDRKNNQANDVETGGLGKQASVPDPSKDLVKVGRRPSGEGFHPCSLTREYGNTLPKLGV